MHGRFGNGHPCRLTEPSGLLEYVERDGPRRGMRFMEIDRRRMFRMTTLGHSERGHRIEFDATLFSVPWQLLVEQYLPARFGAGKHFDRHMVGSAARRV